MKKSLLKPFLSSIPVAIIGFVLHSAPSVAQAELMFSDQFFGGDIEPGVGSWTTPDGYVTITDTGGNFGTGGSGENSFAGNADGASAVAWRGDDEPNHNMILTFNDSNAGLLQIGTRWTQFHATVSGFLFDPDVSVQVAGNVTASASWNEEDGTVRLSQSYSGGGEIILFDFANVEASAGQEIYFNLEGEEDIPSSERLFNNDPYQFAINRVGYEVIPEPGTYALLAGIVALVGVGLVRRNRIRRK